MIMWPEPTFKTHQRKSTVVCFFVLKWSKSGFQPSGRGKLELSDSLASAKSQIELAGYWDGIHIHSDDSSLKDDVSLFLFPCPFLAGATYCWGGGVKAMVENGIVEEGRPCQIPLLSSSMRTIRKIEIDLANLKKWEKVFLYIDVCYWESIQLWQNIVAFDIPFIFCLWYFFADQYMRMKGSQNAVCFFPRSIFSSFSNRNDGK